MDRNINPCHGIGYSVIEMSVTSQLVRVTFVCREGEFTCFLKALYQKELARILAVFGYLGFNARKP